MNYMTNKCLLCEQELTTQTISEDKELCKECFIDIVLTDEEIAELEELDLLDELEIEKEFE